MPGAAVAVVRVEDGALEGEINGGDPCRVFWQVGSSATLDTGTIFVGSIVALTSISALTGASIDGRALARNGAVTLDTNHIARATCADADAGTSDAGASDGSTSRSGDAGVDTGGGAGADTGGAGGKDTGGAGGDDTGGVGADDSGSGADGGNADTGKIGSGDSGVADSTAGDSGEADTGCVDNEGDGCL